MVSRAESYNVYRYDSTVAGGWKLLANVAGTTCTANGLTTGMQYAFRISALNTAGESALSPTVKAIPGPPAIPTGVTATLVSGSTDKIEISWNAVPGATSYEVLRNDGVNWIILDTTTNTSYINDGLKSDTTYEYRVRAINAAGQSNLSTSITVTTPPSIWIDLDIDSFNTSRFGMPSRSQEEDDIEADPNHFGKIIQPNYGDINDNGILDIWDGYNYGSQFNSGTNCSEHFVPIVLEIPQGINLANATFQFDYWLGSPTMTGYSPASPPRFGDGNIRIWTKDGDQPRSANSIHLGGNLVTDGMSYTAQQLGFADTNRTITLYVEGHMLSSTLGNREIIVGMDYAYNGENIHVEDKVKYTVQEEAAWWIESVVWMSNPNGNLLTMEWTGLSVYADKDTPNATNDYRNVNVIVTIGGVVPTGGGMVTLVCIDPENASGTGAANYDGINIFNSMSTVSIELTHGGPKTQIVTATVGTHAGDNYGVLAIPSSGKPYAESETLTVWRRLWVEIDQMQNAAGELAGIPQFSGFPEEQYGRACIQLELYSQPESSEIIAPFEGVVLQNPNLLSPGIASTLVSAVATQRYIPQPTQDFWTVHLVGSFYELDFLTQEIQPWCRAGIAPCPQPRTGRASFQASGSPDNPKLCLSFDRSFQHGSSNKGFARFPCWWLLDSWQIHVQA